MAVREELVRIGGKEVKITRPRKILFPEDGITKGDLIRYYRRIASRMLPHLRNRPLALERYPDGVDQPGFFQKNAPSYYPRWIPNEPEDGVPPDQQLGRGKIDVVLHGQRLRGGFTLIRTRQRSTGPRPRERWLLVKHRDEYADASWEIDSPELDRSVLTGRMLKQIESGRPGRKR